MQDDDFNAFKQAVAGITPLRQDKYVSAKPKPPAKRRKRDSDTLDQVKQAQADFTFSDIYQAHFDPQGPLKYCREDIPTYSLKQLRRGDYAPEWILDCHGMSKQEMKRELIDMLYKAHNQGVACLCILHGIGSGVLKQSLPHYLVQHPYVQAFHQAPLEYGGHGALLLLVDTHLNATQFE